MPEIPSQDIVAAPSPGEELLEKLRPGDTLGSYQLLTPIARGGMGMVWAARRTGRLGLPQIVAVKTALSEANEQTEQLFFDEAHIAASIDHPNVCRVHDLGEEDGILYLAMDWIDGASLSMVVSAARERHLDPHLAAYIVAEACAGLHAAHELRDEDDRPLSVVHRDATPQNILLSAKGGIKVTDFGIVKTSNQAHEKTKAGEVKGKLSYLAPEQLLGKPCDRRVDLFALGAVLYFASTGREAFRDDTAGGTILQVLKGDPARPSALVPGYPEELERIVLRALASQADQRYATAAELRLALQQFLRHAGARVGPEDVARVVNQRLGTALEQRRAKLRAAQQEFDSQPSIIRSTVSLTSSGPAGSSTVAGRASATTSGALTPEPVAIDYSSASNHARLSRPRWRAGAFAIAAALTTVLLWLSGGLDVSRATATPVRGIDGGLAAHGRALASRLEWVTISIDVVPDWAELSVDGAPAQRGSIRLTAPTASERSVLEIRARGYESRSLVVSYDTDRAEVVRLRPSAQQIDLKARHPSDAAEKATAPKHRASAPRTPPLDDVAPPSPPPVAVHPSTRPAPRSIDVTDPFKE